MYILENPVLQRELLGNLRMFRAFILLFLYVAFVSLVVYAAWPETTKVDLMNPAAARSLVNLFFLGQYILVMLMAPSFASGAISGEKERQTYEMLLASPLRPGAIVLGKMFASLTHLGVLVFASLPVVMLCLPLGGASFYEVLVLYLGLLLSVFLFGMISLACSSYFGHTSSALVVSYLLILPLGFIGLLFWSTFAAEGYFRLVATVTVLPIVCFAAGTVLFVLISRRLLYPPDIGSEGKDVVDEEQELKKAVGMVIRRDQFPDNLLAPARRNELLEDGQNPVYDKELRSELFSQGTLMLRLVIQVSIVLAMPLVAVCLYIVPHWAPYYIGYVILFNMLVGPVFSAGGVTSERERQTIDLLLVTTLSPWQILWGKLVCALRVSSVLTSFLMWPLLLAFLLNDQYWANWRTIFGYFYIIVLTCITTTVIGLFFSVVCRKTTSSMMASYLTVLVLFLGPVGLASFGAVFMRSDIPTLQAKPEDMRQETIFTLNYPQPLPSPGEVNEADSGSAGEVKYRIDPRYQRNEVVRAWIHRLTVTSPFAAAFSLLLEMDAPEHRINADMPVFWSFTKFVLLLNTILIGVMIWFFNTRWRVSG